MPETKPIDIRKYYSADPRWNSWKIESPEYFIQLTEKMQFHNNVHPDIVKRYDLIKSVLIHSYLNYEFLDVAFELCLSTLEMALKIRYKEIMENEPENKTFFDLIKWATKQDLFEIEQKIVLHIKDLRNRYMHPNRYFLGGITIVQNLFITYMITNGLYADLNLRMLRKNKKNEINKLIKDFESNGFVLEMENKKLIICKAELLHINNLNDKDVYHFIFWPIFNPIVSEENSLVPFDISSENIIINDNSIVIEKGVHNSETVKLLPNLNSVNVQKYKKWKKEMAELKIDVRLFLIETITFERRIALVDPFLFNTIGKPIQ